MALAAATVPGGWFDGGLYQGIAQAGGKSPFLVQVAASIGTQLGLLVIFGLFGLAWWRARRGPARGMAFVALGVVAVGVAYVLSTVLKDLVQELRPCRAIAGVQTIDPCPAAADWSFPSNHAVLAAAGAVALILIWRKLVWAAVPLALAEGASRVFVGAHYPHDVVAGFLLGSAVALASLLVARPVTLLVQRLRSVTLLAPVLGTTSVASVADGPPPRRVDSSPNSGTYRSDFARW